jgi:citrate synthase
MSSDRKKAVSAICGFDADTIRVRGRDLVEELVGTVSFTDYFYLQAVGTPPSPAQSKILDAVMVTIMEHGMVPSVLATRLTHYGAPESFQGAVAAGLLGVGDRYAGTAGACGSVLEKIVAAPKDQQLTTATEIVSEYRADKKPVPGFGHPIHSQHDPRVPKLIDIVQSTQAEGSFLTALDCLQNALKEVTGKDLVMNISAAIGAALGEAGIPSTMMRGIVLTARCAGLVGHLHEEMQSPAGPSIWDAAQTGVEYSES